MKRSLLFAVCLAAVAFGGAAPACAASPVKIDIIPPLTGDAAAAGQASKEVALDIINNPHPELSNLPLAATAGLPNLAGANLEVTFVDHEGTLLIAQQLATRLITQDKVDDLMGAYQSQQD